MSDEATDKPTEDRTIPAIVRQHLGTFDNVKAMSEGQSGGVVGDLRVTSEMFEELAPTNPATLLFMQWMRNTIETFESMRKAVEDYGAAGSDN